MQQLSKFRIVVYHLYPGLIITAGFIILAPLAIKWGFPPQAGMLGAILLFALPALLIHLQVEKRKTRQDSIRDLNGFTNKIPFHRLILYSAALVIIAFIIWGITQPLNIWIADKFLSWLPGWYTVQQFEGYSRESILFTLAANLLLNGILAPIVEELYFRGYLLSRMGTFGKHAFIVNAVLFSIYHFWQPYLYLTLVLSLLPMTYLVAKTKSLQLAIWTHCLLNSVGAVLSFGLILK